MRARWDIPNTDSRSAQRASELCEEHQSAPLFMKSTSQTPEFINIVLVGQLSSCLDYKQEMPVIEKQIISHKKACKEKHSKKKKPSQLDVFCIVSRFGF